MSDQRMLLKRNAGLVARPWRPAVLIVTLLLAGLLHKAWADAPAAPAAAGPTHKVKVFKVQRGDLDIVSTATVEFLPIEVVAVHAQVPGIVLREGLTEVGELVKKGQVLAQLDPSNQRAILERAEAAILQVEAKEQEAGAAVSVARAGGDRALARIAAAEAVLEIAKETNVDAMLSAAQAGVADARSENRQAEAAIEVAQARLGAARADVRVARSELARFNRQVELTRIVSPIDGVITERSAKPGSPVGPATKDGALFLVARTDQMRVVTAVSQEDVLLVDIGDPVMLRLSAQGASPISSKISRLATGVKGGWFAVEFIIPNPGGRLCAGLFGRATIVLETHRQVLSIPKRLHVDYEGMEHCVRLVRNGRAVRQKLARFSDDGADSYEVHEGLREGDLVIEPGSEFEFGEAVEVIP